jgi:uncharacterized protein
MPEGNAEIVRAGFEAWGRGGAEALLEFIDPGIEWRVRPDLPDAGVYRGYEELGQLLARFAEVLEDQWFEPQEFIEAGDSVVVPLHWGGRGRSSGVEVAERHGETWVFTVANDKVTRVTEYRTKEEALEASGAAE